MPILPKAIFDSNPWIFTLINMGLRGGTLSLRFFVILFVAKELDLGSVAIFGVSQTLISSSPAILGLGLNYHLPRLMGELDSGKAAHLVFRRAVLSSVMAVFLTLLSVVVSKLVLGGELTWILVTALCGLELVGSDFHLGLISLGRSTLANLLLFLRSAAWIPMLGLAHYAGGIHLSLDVIFASWGGTTLLAYSIAALFIVMVSEKAGGDKQSVLELARRSFRAPYIYVNEIAYAVLSGVDRYAAALFLPKNVAGAYIFFANFGGAAYMLVSTGILQVAVPQALRFWKSGENAWKSFCATFLRKALLSILLASTLTSSVSIVSAHYTGDPTIVQFIPLVAVVLSFQILNVLTIATNILLFARGDDTFIAGVNIAGSFLATVLYISAAWLGGLTLFLTMMLLVAALLMFLKMQRLVRLYRSM